MRTIISSNFPFDLDSRHETVRYLGPRAKAMTERSAGYATEAAGAVMRDAKLNGLALVIAVTDPRNVASQRVCARLGMVSRGITCDFYNETNLLFTKSLLS